jgi:restriction system protein
MIENNPSNVSSAFEILLEEVEAEIDFINNIGAAAFGKRDYDRAREALERAGVLTAFRDRVAALRKEWQDLTAAADRDEDEETRAARRNLGKLRKGVRTPESAYYRPILTVLARMGGSGKVADVLKQVEERMRPVLKDVDYEPLASSPDNPRWRNAAQWARNSMIKEGLLKADSPRGVWELTDAGRRAISAVGADATDAGSA